MSRTFFKTNLVFLSAVVLMPGIFCLTCDEYDTFCLYQKAEEEGREQECLDDVSNFCNGVSECKNGTDEKYCNSRDIIINGGCPSDLWTCRDREKCIPMNARCNSRWNCVDRSDEKNCADKRKLIKWLSDEWSTRRKVHELYLTAVALYLAYENFYLIGPYAHSKERPMAVEVKSQLLLSLTSEGDLKSNELALSIHALLVTCNDPWDFYGFNLVSELRAKVELDSSRPFELLALCNARDVMTPQDAQRAADAFHSKERGFTRDDQALDLLALACIRTRTNFTLNGSNMSAMVEELKQGQFTNGSMGSLRTTALVLQVLIATQSKKDYNFETALYAIFGAQNMDGSFGSFSDSYYVSPLMNRMSLLNISSNPCPKKIGYDATKMNKTLAKASRLSIQYTIQKNVGKTSTANTRTLNVSEGSSFYTVIEIVNVLDSNQKVQYNVVDGKPYLSAVNDLQEDLERGFYWYTYLRRDKELKWMKESPVDVEIQENDELILWYK